MHSLSDDELAVLRSLAGETPPIPWGAWVGACIDFLQEDGYVARGHVLKPTERGLSILKAHPAEGHGRI